MSLKEQKEKALLRFYQTLTNQPNLTPAQSQNLVGLLPKAPYETRSAQHFMKKVKKDSVYNGYAQS